MCSILSSLLQKQLVVLTSEVETYLVVAILGSWCVRYSPQDRHSCALREQRSCVSFHWRALCFPHFWTSSSCLLALTASWYSGRWSKVQPGPKFFLKQVRASMPGWSAQEARKGGHLLDWEHLPMKSECVHTKALTPAQGEPQFSES